MSTLAPAQHRAGKEYVFSGFATEAMCHQLPVQSFTIGPSGDRWKTKDRLTINCVPGLLSFTFSIDTSVPSAFDQKIYTFRWGESKDPRHTGFDGQFTRREKQCTDLSDLFYNTVSNVMAPGAESASEQMHWSANCYGDDMWGTSMEIEVSAHARERNPRTMIRQ